MSYLLQAPNPENKQPQLVRWSLTFAARACAREKNTDKILKRKCVITKQPGKCWTEERAISISHLI